MAEFPQSRTEEILYATINGEEYTGLPESRIEELLLELKEVIESGGGGGGGTSNYNLLENLPQINSITLKGDKSLADLGIIAEIKKAMDMITGYFDNTVDYSAGDIVVYDKKLYKFTVDHTAGDWNNLEVSQTTVEELLSGKVDKVSGKGLSTNDYTNEDKGIVAGVTSALAGKADKSELPDVATASDVGLVKPDGTSITVDANGVLTAVGGGGSSDPYDGRKIIYTISASNWSSSPNSDGYYTYSLTLTNPLTTSTSPNVYIAGASDSTQPTATESTMFSYVKRCNLSSTTTLVLYASTKPTSTFYVFVGAEGGAIGERPLISEMTAFSEVSGNNRYTLIQGGYKKVGKWVYIDALIKWQDGFTQGGYTESTGSMPSKGSGYSSYFYIPFDIKNTTFLSGQLLYKAPNASVYNASCHGYAIAIQNEYFSNRSDIAIAIAYTAVNTAEYSYYMHINGEVEVN